MTIPYLYILWHDRHSKPGYQPHHTELQTVSVSWQELVRSIPSAIFKCATQCSYLEHPCHTVPPRTDWLYSWQFAPVDPLSPISPLPPGRPPAWALLPASAPSHAQPRPQNRCSRCCLRISCSLWVCDKAEIESKSLKMFMTIWQSNFMHVSI